MSIFIGGTYRVRGDVVELWPSYESFAVKIEFFGDEVEKITYINPVSAEKLAEEEQLFVYPAGHYVMPADRIEFAISNIKIELEQQLMKLRQEGKLLEAQRLQARTLYDMEMIKEVGFCSGIENYSRHLSGLPAGARPYTLIDYFPKISCCSSTNRTLPFRRFARCTSVTGTENRFWLTTDFDFPALLIIGLCGLRSFRRTGKMLFSFPQRPLLLSLN
jgi:hypothetical protein